MRLHQNLLLSSLFLALAAGGCKGWPPISMGSQVSAPPAAVTAEKQTTATLMDAQVEQKPGWTQVVGALDLWKKGSAAAAVQQITKAQQLGGNDTAFFLHAGDMLAQAKAWPLAAVMYLNLKRIRPENLPVDQLNKIHEAAYRSGEDPQVVRVYMVYQDPWLDLGRIRSKLRLGDVTTATADIQSVTSDASLLAEFPEALMVETEVFIAQKQWHKANEDLDKLSTFANLPDWITREVSQLRGLAQPY